MQAYAARLLIGLTLCASACGAAHAKAPQVTVPSASLSPTGATWSETGKATWYGPRHEGLRTTSGDRFDSRQLTAAHPTLPMGALVRVTDMDTGRTIVVRVNDREPPHGRRCIDLSRGAAERLGIVNRGIANVVLARATEAEELAEAPQPGAAPPPREATALHGRRHRRHAAR